MPRLLNGVGIPNRKKRAELTEDISSEVSIFRFFALQSAKEMH
jgi:hypothetical protein